MTHEVHIGNLLLACNLERCTDSKWGRPLDHCLSMEDQARSRKNGSSGMGLPITAQICRVNNIKYKAEASGVVEKTVKFMNVLTIGKITLNYDTMQGYADEQPIDLPNKDFMLLSYLMQNQGKVLDRESILIKVWGFDYEGDTRVVDTHIKKNTRFIQ